MTLITQKQLDTLLAIATRITSLNPNPKTITSLIKNGLIAECRDGGYIITNKGREFLECKGETGELFNMHLTGYGTATNLIRVLESAVRHLKAKQCGNHIADCKFIYGTLTIEEK